MSGENDHTQGNDDSFEVLDLTDQNQSNTMMSRIYSGVTQLKLDSPAGQVVVGSASGWFVGYLFKKVGKTTASAVGGGLILIKLAHQSGYISINWGKVNRDVDRARVAANHARRNQPELQSIAEKVERFVKSNAAASAGFIGGFLLGLAT